MTELPIDPLPRVWDPDDRIGDMLKGKRGLVVGVANESSIAFGCAAKLRAFGADLAVTWLNDKAERFVRPLAEQVQASLMMQLDVDQPGQLEAVFGRIADEWGRLDFVIHSIAFAPRDDLHGRVVDCSAVRAPQGNGCAERFIRTLKENLLWVRTFDSVEDLRGALLEFREIYNTTWLIERHGFRTPSAVRHQQLSTTALAA